MRNRKLPLVSFKDIDDPTMVNYYGKIHVGSDKLK